MKLIFGRLASMFAVVAVLTGFTAAVAPANAEALTVLTASEEAQLRTFFDEYGVQAKVQERLIKSYENGTPWDSLTQGAQPVSVRTETADGLQSIISTFADGSIEVSSTSVPQAGVSGGIGTLGVSGCSTSSTAYSATYSNCLAKVNLGVISMGFRFSWRKVFGTSATITSYNASSYEYSCIGCVLSNHRVFRISSTNVRYAADLSVAFKGFPAGWTAYMGVKTSLANGAVTYNN